jgi:microcystin-dependent protein
MPYLGEIRIHAGSYAPSGWAFCDGQLLSTSTYSRLFQVLGTRFGGDGVSTFALPDLRGRAPIKPGQGVGLTNRQLGDTLGVETVTLSLSQMASHTHAVRANSGNGSTDTPTDAMLARNPSAVPQFGPTADVNLAANAITASGGDGSHNNMQPYLVLSYIIAIQGTAP